MVNTNVKSTFDTMKIGRVLLTVKLTESQSGVSLDCNLVPPLKTSTEALLV